MVHLHGPLTAVIAALLAAGVGVPIPEDLSLLTAGYLVWHHDEPFALVLGLCLAAILLGDVALYWLGRRFGPSITAHRHLRHRLTPRRLERLQGYFHRHGAKTILVGRFAAGARALFFLAAGAMRMSFWRFLFFDGLAATFSATAWILIGWRFGAQIDWLRHFIHRIEHILLLVLAASLSTWLIARFIRRRITGPSAESGPAAATEM